MGKGVGLDVEVGDGSEVAAGEVLGAVAKTRAVGDKATKGNWETAGETEPLFVWQPISHP